MGVDPAAGRERIRRASDPRMESLRNLLDAWRTVFGDRALSLAEVSKTIDSQFNNNTYDALKDAMCAFDPRSDGRRFNLKPLGWALKRYEKRIVSGMYFESGEKGREGLLWAVREVEE
jgi:hypothetical protein